MHQLAVFMMVIYVDQHLC